MSSYNGHSLFALILSLFYFLNPIYCLLTIVGANMSDFDHDVKKTELYKITIFGLIVFIILYVLKSSYFIGVLILLMVIMFYFSNHRGFTHSLVGGLILTSLIFAVIFFSMELSYQIPSDLNINFPAIFLDLISVLLCILFVNKKISYMIIGFFVLWTLMFPVAMINFELVAFSIFRIFKSYNFGFLFTSWS